MSPYTLPQFWLQMMANLERTTQHVGILSADRRYQEQRIVRESTDFAFAF